MNRILKLGDVCDLQNGFAFKSGDYIEKSNTLNIRMSNIRPDGSFNEMHKIRYLPDSYAEKYKEFLLEENDLIIAMTDMAGEPKILGLPTLVKNLNGRKFLLNQRVGKLHKFSEEIYVPYLCYFLQTLKEYFKNKGAGGLQINISKNEILSANIILKPIIQQKQIVAKLDASFAEIDKIKKLDEIKLKSNNFLIQSYLDNIFESNSNLLKLSDCCEINPLKSEVKNLDDDTEVSFIPMKDLIINNKLATPNQKRRLKDVKGSYTYFSEGDVLLAKITPCFENGKIGIASNLHNSVGFGSSEYIVFRSNENLKNEWLYYFLNRKKFRIDGSENMSGAVGHKRVNKDFIENTLIPIPTVKKQQKIISDLESLFNYSKEINKIIIKKQIEIDCLKKSILKQLLNISMVDAA